MTSIATAILVLSGSLFTASLFKMLAPAGNTEKILRLVISLFVLICVVTAIKSIADNIDISDNSIADISENVLDTDKNVLRVTGDYLVEYTDELLKSQDVEANKIKLTVDTDKNGVINITSLNIYLDKDNASEKHKISELIEKDLNVTPSIILED